MNSSPRKRLQLTSETLQRLAVDELAIAVGGIAPKRKLAHPAPIKPVSGGSCAGFGCHVSRQCTHGNNCGG